MAAAAAAHGSNGKAMEKHAREALSTIFKEFLRHHPGEPSAYSNLGNILVLSQQFDEGARLYEQALALQPDQRDFLSNYGYCLFHQRKLGEAKAVLERALRLSPGFALALSSLARVERAMASGS